MDGSPRLSVGIFGLQVHKRRHGSTGTPGLPGFRVGAGVNYRDKTYSDITNVNSVPAFVLANALLGYQTPHWGMDLNIHNLTNQRYFIAANEAGAYAGEPFL